MKNRRFSIILLLLIILATGLLMAFVFKTYVSPGSAQEEKGRAEEEPVRPATAEPGDAMFRADPQRTGHFAGAGPKSPPEEKWRFENAAPYMAPTSPALAGGLIYETTFIDLMEDGGPLGGATVFDEHAEAGIENTAILAIDSSSGEIKWKYSAQSDSNYIQNSTPVVAADTLFAGGGENACLYALDAATGARKWKYMPPYLDNPTQVESDPVLAGDLVIFGADDGKMRALNQATGVLVWEFATGGTHPMAPALDSGTLFFSGGDDFSYTFYAADAATGTERWRFAAEGFTNSIPSVAAGKVYFTSADSHVYALDEQTGALVWKFRTGDSNSTSTAVADGLVIVGGLGEDNFGALFALDAITGEMKWNVRSEERFASQPVVADGVVYAGNQDGHLYAFDIRNGEELWKVRAFLHNNSPIIAEGVIYFSDDSGSVTALQ